MLFLVYFFKRLQKYCFYRIKLKALIDQAGDSSSTTINWKILLGGKELMNSLLWITSDATLL